MNNTGTPADVAPSEAPTPDGARVTGPALDAHYRFLLRLPEPTALWDRRARP